MIRAAPDKAPVALRRLNVDLKLPRLDTRAPDWSRACSLHLADDGIFSTRRPLPPLNQSVKSCLIVLVREALTRMKTTLDNRLTHSIITGAEPSDRPKRISDGRGMYLEISPAGGRLWRLKFRFAGKEKCMSLGTYPDVSLAKARQRREAARRLVAYGVNPVERRRAQKALLVESTQNSFKDIALEWHRLFSPKWTVMHGFAFYGRSRAISFPGSAIGRFVRSPPRNSSRCCAVWRLEA